MSALQPIRIVGGGLAGLSLGIALRKAGVQTEVFEAGDYPRHRVCGEFVTGLDDDTIEQLGISPAFAEAGSHRSVAWFVRERAIGRQTLPAPARALSRFALDARLAKLFVAEGGHLSVQTRFKPMPQDQGLVLASGRRASGSSPWFGLKLHARNLTSADELEFHLGDGAYVGLSSVEEGWINVCGLFRRRHGLLFDRDDALPVYLRACGLRSLAERLAIATIRPGSRCAVAGFAFDRHVKEDVGLRLGDACAMTPPFTGNGMAMAFTSASLAVAPLVAWSRGEQMWDDTVHTIHKALRNEFCLRLASASFLHHFLLNRTLQPFLGGVTHAGFLPLTTLYRLTH
jgi:menaquinone-9 beta-reductase